MQPPTGAGAITNSGNIFSTSGGWMRRAEPDSADAAHRQVQLPGPYARPGFIDSHQWDFSSLLRFAEVNFGLHFITNRDPFSGPW